jgi:hypothetical protein
LSIPKCTLTYSGTRGDNPHRVGSGIVLAYIPGLENNLRKSKKKLDLKTCFAYDACTGGTKMENPTSQDMKDVEISNSALKLITNRLNTVHNVEYVTWKMLWRIENRLRERADEILKSLQGENQ